MLTTKDLESIFPIKGFYLVEITTKANTTTVHYILTIEDTASIRTIEFDIPKPNEDGTITINGTDFNLIPKVIKTARYGITRSINDTYCITPNMGLAEVIRTAISKVLLMGYNNEHITAAILAFITSTTSKVIPLYEKATRSWSKAIRLELDLGISDNKIPADWQKHIDILTIGVSKNIGKVFRLAKGATIKNNKIVIGEHIFSEIMYNAMIFPENTKPTKLASVRTTVENQETLVYPEKPTIRHKNYTDELSGKHLVTAILAHPLNYNDSIVLSESAAKKLKCYKNVRTSHIVESQHTPLPKVGDKLLDKKADKIATITKAFSKTTMLKNETIYTHTIEYTCKYDLQRGDKITTRHGNKGTVVIIPDKEMPVTESGVQLEALIHPLSIVGRKTMGLIREMMLSKMPNEEILVEHFSDKFSIGWLISNGLDKSVPVSIGNKKVGDAFYGKVYWVRLNKHAIDIATAISYVKPICETGLNPDNSSSGQRVGPDILTALRARGIEDIPRTLKEENIESEATKLAERVELCLKLE